MRKDANIATTKKMGEAINSGHLEELQQVFAAHVTDHDPAPDQGPGPQGFMNFFRQFREAFPDLKVSVDQLVADEESVAIAYTITGKQDGVYQGIPPTGKRIEARGVQIARFDSDGKIVERWGSSDEAGILRQLGGPNQTAQPSVQSAAQIEMNTAEPITAPTSTGRI